MRRTEQRLGKVALRRLRTEMRGNSRRTESVVKHGLDDGKVWLMQSMK